VRRSLILAFVALLVAAALQAVPDGHAEPHKLRAAGLKAHLTALQRIAMANGGNRATGTNGERATVAYVARTLDAAGWQVQRQRFAFPYFWERSPAHVDLPDGRALVGGRDLTTLTYSGAGTGEGPLRPAGSGCTADEAAPLEAGDVALVLRGGCRFGVKAQRAQDAGAVALVVVDVKAEGAPPIGSLLRPGLAIPAVIVGAAPGGDLQAAAPGRARVTVDAIAERRWSTNVVAETAGPRGRVVMAGAHVDSVPAGPGINDDGSGVAALLEVARALGGRAPGDRIRLGFWGAEEPGLFGSTRYVNGLTPTARGRIAAYLNLDMIGSPNPKRAVYTGADAAIERLLRSLIGPSADREDQSLARSDHVPFRDAGIPIGGLFTGTPEPWDPCYHRACDTVSNVNAKVLLELTRVTAAALTRLSAPSQAK
jgi:Zn-dependent M28 family amino/carboxypeptidase